MAPHSSTLAWKIPWTEEPGRLWSIGSWKVGHDWATSLSLFTFMHWRRKWQPTPVFLAWRLPGTGEHGGLLSMGSHRVGHDWRDLAAAEEVAHFPWLLALSSTFKVYSIASFSLSILFPLISWPIFLLPLPFYFQFFKKISVFKLLKFLLIILSINNAYLASLLLLFFLF